MKVQFNVTNEGLGEPFYHWWRDRVVSIGGTTKEKKEFFDMPFNDFRNLAGILPPGNLLCIPTNWNTI